MKIDPNRQRFLEIIEAQSEIGGRFLHPKRLGANGGDGTFSLLCEASDKQRGNTKVALKFLNPLEPQEYRRRCFQREPEILSLMNGQKDILQIIAPRAEFSHEFGGLELTFSYYAVELAVSDLGNVIEAGTASARDMLLHFRAMCRGVQRLQRLYIAHRDIKPNNFLIMPDGCIKLSDFGTARQIGAHSDGLMRDYAGYPPGHLGYSAPEILASLHDDDPKVALDADMFSLGCCIFEMFSGVPLGIQLFDQAFQQDLLQAMARVRRGERRRIYDQFVGSIANSHPLPSIATFAPTMPRCIVPIVDELYGSMAALDYRRRMRGFERIFWMISRGILNLDNQDKIRSWRQRRKGYQTATDRVVRRPESLPGNRSGA